MDSIVFGAGAFVDLLVDTKVGRLGEGLVANGAHVGLGFGVNASVSVEVRAIREALATFFAGVGFALEVNVHVILEGGRVGEFLGATGVRAAEGAFVVVSAHVFVEGGGAVEATTTNVASEEFIGSASEGVVVERGGVVRDGILRRALVGGVLQLETLGTRPMGFEVRISTSALGAVHLGRIYLCQGQYFFRHRPRRFGGSAFGSQGVINLGDRCVRQMIDGK